jgi:16S rRNA (cytidine1402-2'-O)-methyltransferase
VSALYLVSTPIGNLADITLRAIRTLREVDRVYAEDTRRTRILLDHHGIDTPLSSVHQHNERARVAEILKHLDAGRAVAVVSDAGTPLVSDPGGALVPQVIEAGHDVVAIPGASAVLTALVASGLPTERFVFLGFVPRRGHERERALERIARSEETSVLFESPERLTKLLTDLAEHCGPDRRIAVARELTKVHEQIVRGTPAEVRSYYEENRPRGEVTMVVAPHAGGADLSEVDREAALGLARDLLDEGFRPSQAAKELARRTGMQRNEAYRVIHSLND